MVDTSELENNGKDSEDYMQILGEVARNLPPDTRVSAEGALAGVEVRELKSAALNSEPVRNMHRHNKTKSESNAKNSQKGSGVGVVRTWLSHVSEPNVALGPTDAVFVWEDPYRAERELRRRLDTHSATAATAESAVSAASSSTSPYGGNQPFSGLDAILWSGDVASEAVAERARLLYHLGICLRQQITNLGKPMEPCSASGECMEFNAASEGAHGWAGALQRGRFELMMAATEALSVARELGHTEADGELEDLRREMSGGDDVEAERNDGSQGRSGFPKDGQSRTATNSISDERTAQRLDDVTLITISNSGYSDYTLNAMASLRIHCKLPCLLQVILE